MIDTEALRKKVIDLAIQGKLTEQLPSDGDAEFLYAQIQEEKANFIKEGKIKKDISWSSISDEETPFEIPKNWKWVRFGDLMWNRDSERIPVSVEDRKKLEKVYDYYGASGVIDKVDKYLFESKLLLIGEDGANLLSRNTPIAFIAQGKFWVNNHAHVLGYFLYDYLDFVMFYINGISLVPYVTGAAQPKLNQDNMNKIPVPLPPMDEQIRIVDIVKKSFAQIDIIDKLQQQYKSDLSVLKGKIIDAGIRGKLTEQLPEDDNAETLYLQIQEEKAKLIKEGKIKKEKPLPEIDADEIPFEIPKNWKWVRLRDLSRKIVDGDHNPPSGVKEKTDFLMLSAQNINEDKIVNIENARYLTKDVFIEENKRTQLEIGDVLLTIVATLGRSCVYRENYNVCFQRSVCVISSLINPDYLKRVFDSAYIQRLMIDNATGAAQPGFYLNKVERMCIPVPPLKEQNRIVNCIDEILKYI